jgi:hypothetical protein
MSKSSLPAHGELTLGYGDYGAAPLSRSIDNRRDQDVGFFKVYYSMTLSDMSSIQQDGLELNLNVRQRHRFWGGSVSIRCSVKRVNTYVR